MKKPVVVKKVSKTVVESGVKREFRTKKKKSISYTQLIPSNLNLEEIIKAEEPKFVYSIDLFVHLVHLTIEIPAKKRELMGKNGYVPFHTPYLQPKSRDYHKHLEYLVLQGILETDNQHIVGKKSRCYRISEKYLSERLVEIDITDEKLVKKIGNEHSIDFHARMKYADLYEWFNDKITIDFEGAMEYCYEELEKEKKENYYDAYSKAYSNILKMHMLKNRIYWFNVDEFGKRLHTNFTNLTKGLKPFISYNNIPLVSIDIPNSQPLLSLKVLKEKFPSITFNNNNQNKPNPLPPLILVKQAETPTPIDVQRYADLVISGTFYGVLEQEMRKKFGGSYFTRKKIYDFDKGKTVINTKTPRQMVKAVTYQVFFSKNYYRLKKNKKLVKYVTREKELFSKLFPTVMQVFEQYKDNLSHPEKDRHKALAKALQRIESRLMLDKIAPELAKQKPCMPRYTIHDSFVTTLGNEEFVKSIMKDFLIKEIGFSPELIPEIWCKDCGGIKKAA